MAEVDNQTTILMGHTRWRTRGCETNSRNNHPIRSDIIIGTHNGTIYNADYLFRRICLPRYAEVDSELLFRLADRFAPDGTINGRGFRKALRLCRGQMSAVLASRLDPGAITVIKGKQAAVAAFSRKHRALLYASEPEYIEAALDNLRGWRELGIPTLTMLTFRHETLKEWQRHPFKFVCQERKGTLPEGVKV